MKKYSEYYKSPIGIIKITASKLGIISISFIDKNLNEISSSEFQKYMDSDVYKYLRDCKTQLNEYFMGKRREFSLRISLQRTDFRKKVWNELMKISYGSTCSYMDIADRIGNRKAVRAVGGANHNNNIIIVIPCHRVIGKDGNLTGYSGGLWRKKWLLNHEKNFKSIVD